MSNISSNILYVEPNYTYSHSANTYESFNEYGEKEEVEGIGRHEEAPPLEDYCVAFQLTVEVPMPVTSGFSSTANRVFRMTYNSGDSESVSLLQGTKILSNRSDTGSTSINYLTTAALETTLEDVKKESSTEMFGVKTIDVSYDAWATPTITITFTDVRGSSLFVPEELRHPFNGLAKDSNGNTADVAGSFFKCFFTMPMPLFGLVMKGFYGEAVGYELMYSNVSYKLDSSSGNYDVTVKFIGYTYSVLGDISFNAVACAPYSENWGKEYWENEVKKGRFVTDEGTPMPTLAQIFNSYRNLKNLTNPIPQLDNTAQRVNAATEKTKILQQQLDAVTSNVTALYNAFKSIFKDSVVPIDGDTKYGFVALIGSMHLTNLKAYLGNVLSDNEAKNAYTVLRNFLTNGFQATNTPLFLTSINDISKYETLENACDKITNFCVPIFEVSADGRIQSFLNEKAEGVRRMPVEVANSIAYNNGKKNETLSSLGLYHGFIINTREWYKTLSEEIKTNESELVKSEEEMKIAYQQNLAQAIGMAPTLYNIMRVIMAHLETIIHCVFMCSDAVKASNRTFASTKIDNSPYAKDVCGKLSEQKTSEEKNTNQGSEKLPPFPEVKSNGIRDGIKIVEDDWLGELSNDPELYEVSLVESLLKAVEIMKADYMSVPQAVVDNGDGTKYEGAVACPIVPSDVLVQKSLFNMPSINQDNVAELAGVIALRGAYIIHAMRDIAKNPKVAGEVDAVNFYSCCNNQMSQEWRTFITQTDSDKFSKIVSDIVFNVNPTEVSAAYTNKGLPWTTVKQESLLNGDAFPNLPTSNSTKGNTLYMFPITNLSFQLQPYVVGDGNGYTNDYETYAPIGYHTASENDLGTTLMDIVTGPNIYANISNLYESELVKDIKNIGHLKDNVTPLKDRAKIGGDYKSLFNQNHDTFVIKFSASDKNEGKSVNIDTPCVGSFTLPTSKAEAQNTTLKNTAFSKVKLTNDTAPQNKIYTLEYPSDTYAGLKQTSLFGKKELMTECKYFDGSKAQVAKRKKIDIGEFISNEGLASSQTALIDWTIPRFYGITPEGDFSDNYSLFTQKSYYNATTSHEKATLFLGTLFHDKGIKVDECLKVLLKEPQDNGKDGYYKVLPYPFILLIGAYFYFEKEENRKTAMPIVTSMLKKLISDKDLNFWGTNNAKDALSNSKKQVKRRFITEFTNWVDGKDSTILGINAANIIKFKYIDLAFALPTSIVGCTINLDKIDSTKYPYGCNKLFAALYNMTVNTNPLSKSCEQIMASAMGDEFFKNYITFKVGDDTYKGTAKLYLRESSEVVDKLVQFYIQPTMVVCFQEWTGLGTSSGTDGARGKNPKDLLKTYFKGFHYRMNELLKRGTIEDTDNTNKQASFNADIDKHIKIALYKYLKLLHDRWASTDLFVDSSGKNTHWDLENFFDKHFHFIDQFYINCKDIFFDLSDAFEMFENSFSNQTMSLFDYISRALAKCKATMYPVQNFLDYYEESGQKKLMNLFKPLSYVDAFKDALEPHQIYPDFVILYKSEPSKKANNDGCDDTFMLNADEVFLPKPIRSNPGVSVSKGGVGRRIPCFGVSYGKQYQSYFHSIDVSTDSPLPTEQAFQAQYMIAGGGTENGQQIGTLGQDLYSIYSNNSYTCTVQMMGNMWIQPTMYFVLTNVPTFRGSYMIQKVTHQMTPGRMTTTFMGTRMANSSQPHVYNWFIGSASNKGGDSSTSDSELNASPENDCPYKVFIPGTSKGTGTWTNEMLESTVENFVKNPEWESQGPNCAYIKSEEKKLYNQCKTETVLDMFTYIVCKEQGEEDEVKNGILASCIFNTYTNKGGGLPGKSLSWVFNSWKPHNTTFGSIKTRDNDKWEKVKNTIRNVFLNSPACMIGKEVNQGDMYALTHHLNPKTNKKEPYNPPEALRQVVERRGKVFPLDFTILSRVHRQGDVGDHAGSKNTNWSSFFCIGEGSRTSQLYGADDSVQGCWELKQDSDEDANPIVKKLTDLVTAIKNTCQYSQNIDINDVNFEVDVEGAKVTIWSGKDKSTPSKNNATLFDIALNAYSEYHQTTCWIVPSKDLCGSLPTCVELGINPNGKVVKEFRGLCYNNNGTLTAVSDSKDGTLNEYFYRSIAKKYLADNDARLKDYNSFKCVCLNMKDLSEEEIISILTKYRPSPCFASGSDTAANSNGSSNGTYWIKNGNRLPPEGDYGLSRE